MIRNRIGFIIIAAAIILTGCSKGNGLPLDSLRPAPDFKIDLLDGGNFTLSEFKGRPVLVNFWAPWCMPCREETPTLEETYKKYKDKGVMFIGIAVQTTEEKVRPFVKDFGVTYPIAMGTGKYEKIKESFNVYGLPTTYIIDRDGMISYVHLGGISRLILEDELEKVL